VKILVGIPCLFGHVHTKQAIDSVINESDVLIIDNGSEQLIKDLILGYKDKSNVHVIRNKENIFVNPAWNQIIDFFLKNEHYDSLVIMNSDVIMERGWSDVLMKVPTDIIAIPNSGNQKENIEVHNGTNGVFIHINRKHAKIIYPIPEYCKVWFGDQFIYTVLRKLGYKTIVYHELIGNHYHNGSQNVSKVHGISEIIEEDKKYWELNGEISINEIINKNI
jgi:GT2 family glycosyltransferase